MRLLLTVLVRVVFFYAVFAFSAGFAMGLLP